MDPGYLQPMAVMLVHRDPVREAGELIRELEPADGTEPALTYLSRLRQLVIEAIAGQELDVMARTGARLARAGRRRAEANPPAAEELERSLHDLRHARARILAVRNLERNQAEAEVVRDRVARALRDGRARPRDLADRLQVD